MTKEVLVINNITPATSQKIAEVITAKKQFEEQYNEFAKQLKQSMEVLGIYSYKDDNITISYTCESNPIGVDLDKLKTKYPDVYADCLKVGHRGSSIKISKSKQKDDN